MTKTQRTLTLGALLAILLAPAMAFAAKSSGSSFKCWTNKDGVRECGNVIPPEYSQGESETINKQGVTVDVQERAKTPEELEAARKAAAEEERLKAEEQQRRDDAANYDRVLLGTFTSERDINDSLQRKLSSLEAMITVNHATLEKLTTQLADKLKQANNFDSKDQPIPQELKEEIDNLERQVKEKDDFINGRKQEQEVLRAEYTGYLKRFRELKGISAPQ